LESKTEFFNYYLQTQKTGRVGALQKFWFPIIVVVFAFTKTTSHEIFNVSIGSHFEVDCSKIGDCQIAQKRSSGNP
jgi:hypothetical protein